jgi:transposase
LVPDNLKAGVTSPCYYEPGLNQGYAELARFYDLTVLPARVRKPRDKAKVENAVQQVERWVLAPLRDRTFFGLSELNAAIAGLVIQANARVMKGPDASRDALFEDEDRPAMRELPASRYAFADWKTAKVAPDYHVEFEGHRYSVPYTLVARRVDIRIGTGTVEIHCEGKKVASHARCLRRRGFTTADAHMPEGHRQGQWNPERLESWAGKIGPAAVTFTARVLEARGHKEHGYRTVLGVLRLEKIYGKERLNAACERANSIGTLAYSSVKSILAKNLETAPAKDELGVLPFHDNVRGAGYYGSKETTCAN